MNITLPSDLGAYTAAQDVARATLRDITQYIVPGASEKSLHVACHQLMLTHGATSFWGNTPAFVLAGDRLRLSVFDDSYTPSTREFGQDETITIDVGPRIDNYFGDSARTYFLRGGTLVDAEQAGQEEFAAMTFEHQLHAIFMRTATMEMSFAQIHSLMDTIVREAGYENLDLLNAYGHSIEESTDAFIIMTDTQARTLGSVSYFTFEPHIAKIGSPLAVKYEEIYYFKDGIVKTV